jgi:hypothetical protein
MHGQRPDGDQGVGDSDLEVLRVVRGPRPVGLGAGPGRLLAALAEIR